MEKVIKTLEAKIVSAEKDIAQAKEWIKDIENGNHLLGDKDHYERTVSSSEAYITGLKVSIMELKKELA